VSGLPLGTRGGMLLRHNFPLNGEYLLKVRLWRNNSASIRGLDQPHLLIITLDGKRVFEDTVGTAEDYAALLSNPSDAASLVDPRLQVRVPVTAGPHDVGVTFVLKSHAPNVTLLRPLLASHDPISIDGVPKIDTVLIGGPFSPSGPGDTPSRRRILECRPTTAADELPCARRILTTIARRAYRRPVTSADIDPLLAFFTAGRNGGSFDEGISLALRRVLVEPAFLFRVTAQGARVTPAGQPQRIGDLDLASRLSFFLWSSIPDDELLTLGEQSRLSQPAVLRQQVKRMIASPKAWAFVQNFAGQWLYLRNLEQSHPDTQEFPDFDDTLRQAFRRETELLFESIMKDDKSVLDLLSADYTFVNERLARHYGLSNVYGSAFRRVPVTAEERRGILGHGSILTVTSYPNRTSPVKRGKWILENLLGTPPPPPPPNVPELAASEEGAAPKTMRAQMEEHRKNPACANCHKLMDPLGFAMENFDGVGAWRERQGASRIDPSSVLSDGREIEGVNGLRKALLDRPDLFATTMVDKMLIYALGRGLTAADRPAVRRIVTDAAPGEYRFSSLIQGIVESVPFSMRPLADGADQTTVAGR
jgi:hypothetical protein